MNDDKLPLIFDSRTIGDLGVKMYTRLPHALAESISNAYDADAASVTISIQQGEGGVDSVEIKDDGFGMSKEDLRNNFLVVGRKRREEGGDGTTPKGRKVTGRKGLGKLAMFGIANVVEIETVRDGKVNAFQMCWDDIEKSKNDDCFFRMVKNDVDTQEGNGTKIILTSIKRKTGIDLKDLSVRLSRRFDFDSDFCVCVKSSDSDEEYNLTPLLGLSDVEIEGEFPITDAFFTGACEGFKGRVRGVIKTAKKPMPKEGMQGVSLFARGKLVNEPTAFGSVSSNFFRYLTGELHIDFIEDDEEDLIATNRRSLDWDNEKLEPLERCLTQIINSMEKKWRELRKKKVDERLSEKFNVDFERYLSTLPGDKKDTVRAIVSFAEDHPEHEDKLFNQVLEIVPEYGRFSLALFTSKVKKR